MDNTSTAQATPHTSVYGTLILAAGLFTILIAAGEKSQATLIVGAIATVIGIVLIVIGKNQVKHLQKQEEPK